MNILVLAGGISSERDVSLTTGTLVCNALRELGHAAAAIDLFLGLETSITDYDEFFRSGGPGVNCGISTSAPDLELIRRQRQDQSASHIGPQVLELARAADIVFIALHGLDGEDGKLQAVFDLLGVKYTGSGALPSGVAMDKDLSKMVFARAGLQVPQGVLLTVGEPLPHIDLPCMVKPCSGGSSVGTALAETEQELADALQAAFACEDRVLVEPYIKGREVQVAVLDQQALPPIELDYDSKFFDYVVKYQPNACREICPARIDAATDARLRELALIAHNSIGLSVYSRADFILTAAGEIYILEINTLPGMTSSSLVPQEAAAAGISYNELCQRIIDLSLARFN